eukprot:gene3891-7765_t
MFMISKSYSGKQNTDELSSKIAELEDIIKQKDQQIGVFSSENSELVILRKKLLEENKIKSKEVESYAKDNERLELLQKQLEKQNSKSKQVSTINNFGENTAVRPGVIVLGMHRSGTSIIGGLLNKMGLNAGHAGDLVGPADDNKKGFFERSDVILQNDWSFRRQNLHYSWGTNRYNAIQGLKDIFNDKGEIFYGFVSIKDGQKALRFLNNPNNYPWMLKDPRLCITIRTWLPQLNFIPAILFTFRHPLDVALSMNKRESEQFPIAKALRLWYIHNKRAIIQSEDLCRVISSHVKVMANAQIEMDRIYDELRSCGVPVPRKVSLEDVNEFVDSSLQHGKTAKEDKSCTGDISTLLPPESWPTTEKTHIELYRTVIQAYCAMLDGRAFKKQFHWNEAISD